jgi:hypothetical protein
MRRSTPRPIAIVAALLLSVVALLVLCWSAATTDDERPPSPDPTGTPAPSAVPAEAAETPAPVADEQVFERNAVSEPVPPQRVTLVVRVVDAGSHAALIRARVSLIDAAGDERGGLTDAAGSVRFEKVPRGATEIHVAADRSLPADRTIVLAPIATEVVEVALEAAAALDGVVVDAATGVPLAKATVDVVACGDADERALGGTSSDAAGRFRFDVLPPATQVLVKAWLAGYARAATTAELRAAGTGAARVEVRLPRASVLRGVVRLPDGRGVGDASVKVVSASALGWDGAFAESAADGSFVVRGVPAGVEVAATAHLRRWADSLTQFVTPRVDGGETVCDLVLRRPATLVVGVSSPSGYPPRVEVWVDDDRASAGRSNSRDTKTPTLALSTHQWLSPGPHVVHVEPTEYPAVTREIALAEGERAQIEIALSVGATIDGMLVDDSGTPVAGATVFALTSDFAHPRRRVTDAAPHGASKADGSFRISGVAPGRYDLYVLGGCEYGLASPEIDPTRTAVDAPSKSVRIIVARETRIVLRVAMPDGAPRPSEVALTQDDGSGINANGDTFRRPLLAFDATAWTEDGVVKSAFPPGATWLRVSVAGFAPEMVRVPQWALGRTVDLGEITLDAGVSIRGTVIDSAGRPVAGAVISTSADPPGRVPVSAKDDGTFVVDHVAQGAVVVYAAAEGRIGSRYVTEAFDAKGLTIIARRKGVLSGTVVDAAGMPVAGARVTFQHGGMRSPGSAFEYVRVVAVADDAVTGDDGKFTSAVPYGPCIGRVAGAGFEVFVAEGSDAAVRVVAAGP